MPFSVPQRDLQPHLQACIDQILEGNKAFLRSASLSARLEHASAGRAVGRAVLKALHHAVPQPLIQAEVQRLLEEIRAVPPPLPPPHRAFVNGGIAHQIIIKSELKLSERMADVLQQYLLVTQGNDLGVAVAALDKHGSLDAALEAFFGVAMHVGQDGSGNARKLEQNVENFCKKPLEARPFRAICVRCRRRGARPRLQEEVAQGNARKDLPG